MKNRGNRLGDQLRGGSGEARRPQASAFPLSTNTAPDAIELPAIATHLTPELQTLARQYLTAKRRAGEALLESARFLAEARAQAEHGTWAIFLEVTGTGEDTAEQLLNIFERSLAVPELAEGIRKGWFSQTVAAKLARPSTPPALITTLLRAEKPPKVKDVDVVARQVTTVVEQNPIKSDFAPPEGEVLTPAALGHEDEQLIAQLYDRLSPYLETPIDDASWRKLERLAQRIVAVGKRRAS